MSVPAPTQDELEQSPPQLEIYPLHASDDLQAFLDYPRKCYADEANWVATPDFMVREMLDRSHNPFFKRADADFFMARRGGKPVGRIMAIDDRRHNEVHNENLAFFGFLEAEDGLAFKGLIAAVEDWARCRGRDGVRGPISPTMNESCGFLCEGHGSPPKLMMPYTHQRYLEHIADCGYRRVMRTFAWEVALDDAKGLERLFKLSARVRRSYGERLRVRPLKRLSLVKQLRPLLELLNETWKDNWGYIPYDRVEYEALLQSMRHAVCCDTSTIIDVDGEPAGALINLLNLNEIFQRHDGRLNLLVIAKLLLSKWLVRTSRVAMMGVAPKHASKGLSAVLIEEGIRRSLKIGRTRNLECSWVLESNDVANRTIEIASCKRTKTCEIFERAVKEVPV